MLHTYCTRFQISTEPTISIASITKNNVFLIRVPPQRAVLTPHSRPNFLKVKIEKGSRILMAGVKSCKIYEILVAKKPI